VNDSKAPDYGPLDRPEVTFFLFHPRPESLEDEPETGQNVMVPVSEDAAVGGCFHMAGPAAPNLLFFHGTGEIVADYHEMAPV